MAKFLDLQGLQAAWARTKGYVAAALKSALTDRLGKANGIATLGADSKLTASQLPALKSVNGQSIIGSGNIAIDLSLYKIVQALPTTGIDSSKIYLVVDPSAPEGNVYKEYIYVNSKWELLGEYKADIDLTPYATKEFAESLGRLWKTPDVGGNYITIGDVYDPKTEDWDNVDIPAATTESAGLMSDDDKKALESLKGWQNYRSGDPRLFKEARHRESEVEIAEWFTDEDIPDTRRVTIEEANSDHAGVMSTEMVNKFNGIASGATADEALTTDEINAVLI